MKGGGAHLKHAGFLQEEALRDPNVLVDAKAVRQGVAHSLHRPEVPAHGEDVPKVFCFTGDVAPL